MKQPTTRNGSALSWSSRRHLLLAATAAVALLMAWQPLVKLMRVSDQSDYYSHIILIPFVSAYFLYQYRKAILDKNAGAILPGSLILAGAIVLYMVARLQEAQLGPNDFASLTTLSSVAFFIGGFVVLYGFAAFRAARFPLLFLIFAVPVPHYLLDWFIYILQVGSTEVTEMLFQLTGTDYIRNGFNYQLPGISIYVARECSGIRSSIALVITGVLAGHLLLRTGWGKLILLLSVVPFTIFKNGIRILTLSLLAIYVDPKFITDSSLHHSGGFLFYLLALPMLGGVLWALWRLEKQAKV